LFVNVIIKGQYPASSAAFTPSMNLQATKLSRIHSDLFKNSKENCQTGKTGARMRMVLLLRVSLNASLLLVSR